MRLIPRRVQWWFADNGFYILMAALTIAGLATMALVLYNREPSAEPMDATSSALVVAVFIAIALRPTDYARRSDVDDLRREVETLTREVRSRR